MLPFLLCRLCRFSSILQRHEVWRLRNQFRSYAIFLILNFPEIFTGIFRCLLLNFAESNGYNIILPNIIDASKTHAGHVIDRQEKNPRGSFIVKR